MLVASKNLRPRSTWRLTLRRVEVIWRETCFWSFGNWPGSFSRPEVGRRPRKMPCFEWFWCVHESVFWSSSCLSAIFAMLQALRFKKINNFSHKNWAHRFPVSPTRVRKNGRSAPTRDVKLEWSADRGFPTQPLTGDLFGNSLGNCEVGHWRLVSLWVAVQHFWYCNPRYGLGIAWASPKRILDLMILEATTCHFPENTRNGSQKDTFCRSALWHRSDLSDAMVGTKAALREPLLARFLA